MLRQSNNQYTMLNTAIIFCLFVVAQLRAMEPIEQPGTPSSIAFNKEGTLFAIGCEEGSVALASYADKKFFALITKHTDRVGALVFLDTRHLLVSGSDDKAICFWSMHDMSPTWKISGDAPVASLATNNTQDELYVAIGTSIKIFKVAKNIVLIATIPCTNEPSRILVTPDSKQLVYAASTDSPLSVVEIGRQAFLSCDTKSIGTLCALHPKQKLAALYSKKSCELSIISLESGSTIACETISANINSLMFSSSGASLIGTLSYQDDENDTYYSNVLLFNAKDLKKPYHSVLYDGKIVDAMLHPDGKSIAFIYSDTKQVEFVDRNDLKK